MIRFSIKKDRLYVHTLHKGFAISTAIHSVIAATMIFSFFMATFVTGYGIETPTLFGGYFAIGGFIWLFWCAMQWVICEHCPVYPFKTKNAYMPVNAHYVKTNAIYQKAFNDFKRMAKHDPEIIGTAEWDNIFRSMEKELNSFNKKIKAQRREEIPMDYVDTLKRGHELYWNASK